MSVIITINSVDLPYPSSAKDLNSAAQQILVIQALASTVNAALANSGQANNLIWGDWTDITLLTGVGTLQYRSNSAGDVQLRGAADFIGYGGGTPLAIALIPPDNRPPRPPPTSVDPVGTFWALPDFNSNDVGVGMIQYSDSKLYINMPSADPSINFQSIFYNTSSF